MVGEVPDDLMYTAEHEWIRIDGDEVIIGITDFAQDALTEVVWVELPEVGAVVAEMESFASVESVKSVSEIYAPLSGTVTEVNESLEDEPEKINDDPYGSGWICKINTGGNNESDKLLDPVSYSTLIGD
ncbi:MAG: glycine cleavage system protein GcvH [Candidatus Thermoplasmatota archaeon]|nr:glycine cleavage system protein GcvH [Candidatus Thermoplasmatota archaeon]